MLDFRGTSVTPEERPLLSRLVAFYVDPGSGSMILQILLGGVSGLYVIFRLFKQKILGLFGIRSEPAPRVAEQSLTHPVPPGEDEKAQHPGSV